MPELPEVETVRRSLEQVLSGEKIVKVELYYGGIVKTPDPQSFVDILQGKVIQELKRRGKYLIFCLSDNYNLIIHLRMTGQLILCEPGTSIAKHTHIIFHLGNGRELRFVDIRKFGLIYLVPAGEWQEIKGLYTLGPEPLSAEFTFEKLQESIKNKKVKLKTFLLDQRQIAGIGNIYADEIMFTAGINPERTLESLTKNEIEELYQAIQLKLEEGIKYRGTSFSDYVDGLGEKGSYQTRLNVYQRAGEPCKRCGTTLVKKVVSGRGTVFCPKCQL